VNLVEVPNFFPAILTAEEWQKLKERRTIRGEAPREKLMPVNIYSAALLNVGIAEAS
jgi:hypothetical protein